MITMDVFNEDAFSATSLTAAVDKLDHVPRLLGSIPGLFEMDPVHTEDIWIEERATGAVVLQTSPRGGVPHYTGGDQRSARSFKTVRLADVSVIQASALFAVREFGSETAVKQLATEVARRQFKLKRNMGLTLENLRMGAVLGHVKDADGSTIYDWATEFGQAIPTEVDFDLDNVSPASGAVKRKCNEVSRSILKGLKGVGEPQRIVGLCGDAFWDDLTSHPEIIATYQGRSDQSGAWLRNGLGGVYSTFNYGNVDFINYRGTDDGTTLSVGTDKCKFFPVGAGIFRWAMSPGESFEDLGQLGKEFYSRIVVDKDRGAWANVEVYSYPLPVCTMPQALHQARRT